MQVKLEEVFSKAGINWKEMKENETIDISDKNFKLKSFNHKTGEVEYKRILSLVRKEDSETYELVSSKTGENLFRGTNAHRIYVLGQEERYFSFKELEDKESFLCLTSEGSTISCFIRKTNEKEPILDVEIEDNENYFANNILSHNTTPGGNALKFYASVRLEVKRIEWILEGKETVGLLIQMVCTKNKTAPPRKKYEVTMTFDKGFDAHLEWIDFAIDLGTITKLSSVMYANLAGEKIKGRKGITEYYSDPKNSEEYEEIIRRTRLALGAKKESSRVSVDREEDKLALEAELAEMDKLAEKAEKMGLIKKLNEEGETLTSDGEIIGKPKKTRKSKPEIDKAEEKDLESPKEVLDTVVKETKLPEDPKEPETEGLAESSDEEIKIESNIEMKNLLEK